MRLFCADEVAVRGYVDRMQPLAMKNTPSALKWLAEKRARLANDLEQTRKIAIELTQKADALESDLARPVAAPLRRED